MKAGVRRTLALEALIPTVGVSLPRHLSMRLPSVPVLPAQAPVLSSLVSTKQLEIVSKANLLKKLRIKLPYDSAIPLRGIRGWDKLRE